MRDLLKDLQTWYIAQCDEDWEHEYGVEIGTLDNPGWYLKVDLNYTILVGKELQPIEYEKSENDWLACRVEDHKFVGYGGPDKLEELLSIFLEWAKTEKDWLAVPPPPTQEDQDREWFEGLGDEVGPEICNKEGCKKKRIENGVKCRIHHFEMIKGYLPEFK